MTEPYYDALVIGAGIHGAGVARALADRGHAVLVVEQHGVASGTSSRSSKLIHGGLRYLESGQFALVRECLRERAWLLRHFPDLVRLVPFHIPIYRHTRRRPAQIAVGLSLYALLTGFDRAARFRRIPRHQWGCLDGLDTHALDAVYQYWDAQTDDAALTRAVLAAAQARGADLWLPAELQRAEREGDVWRVQLRVAGGESVCRARVVVNAAGPWVNRVLERLSPRPTALAVDLVQGTHIVVRGEIRGGIYYVEAPQDGRAVFVMPWQGRTLIGTTENLYSGDPAAVRPLDQEKTYLLEVAARYFPRLAGLGANDILASFAGLRVLPHSGGSAFSRPRDTLLHVDHPGRPHVVTIYGGKLTAQRATAERVARLLAGTLGRTT